MVVPQSKDWMPTSNQSTLKTVLVPISSGCYILDIVQLKWQWPNSAHISYMWHALLLWHTYVRTQIYMYIPHQFEFVASHSLHSLANYKNHSPNC